VSNPLEKMSERDLWRWLNEPVHNGYRLAELSPELGDVLSQEQARREAEKVNESHTL
jgi:hypothetical protein